MDRAVVLGGSVAGVLAARVLTDYATEVVVVDRDDLSGGAEPRRGVPQGRQLHALLSGGLAAIESFFPGVTGELVDAGAVATDPGVDCHWYVDGLRKPPAAIGLGVACTRPFLEWHLRRRLLALPGVSVVRGQADALTAAAGRVDSVVVSDREGVAQHLAADLVVDCTGRSSRLSAWLVELGYTPPPDQNANVDLGYATRFFRRDTGERLLGGALSVMSLPRPSDSPRGAAAFAVEDGKWMVMVGAYHHDRPSQDAHDFVARLNSDPTPAIRCFAGDVEPLGPVAVHRFAASVRHDFNKLKRLPAGVLAAGDAVASFNPIYGQGMTSAALQATAMDAHLASGCSPREPAFDYFHRLGKIVDSVWRISATEDFRLPHVTGDKPRGLRLAHWGSDVYREATLRDADIHRLFLQVLNLQVEAQVLMRPATLMRAYRASRRPVPERR